MPLLFRFSTIWLIYGLFIISILKIRVAEVSTLIARLTFVFIVWFIMMQIKLSAHTFTPMCISSNSLRRPGSFRIFYTNHEWLYFYNHFDFPHDFKTTDTVQAYKFNVKMDQIFNFSTKMTPFTN